MIDLITFGARAYRGFNEAAALLPRRSYAGAVFNPHLRPIASMRPRHYCRGDGCYARIKDIDEKLASMRPRHYCRGDLQLRVAAAQADKASMRPRHYCRGDLCSYRSLSPAG